MSENANGGGRLAPVVPLFGGAVPTEPVASAENAESSRWHMTWQAEERSQAPVAASTGDEHDGGVEDGDRDAAVVIAERAETRLKRALASRGMSEREARDRLRRDNVEQHAIEDIVYRLVRVGAIDDGRLAEQLVHTALTRKNQGRRAISQSLAKRGIARDAIDAALEELPDDDHERALDFARTKARPLARLDHETALRRLVGQLSRRGFGGSLAMTVANQALDEACGGAATVRFR